MGIEVRLKTGFFETTAYRLEIGGKQLRFLPSLLESGTEISLHEAEISSVTLLDREPIQFEIQTESMSYIGSFVSNGDLESTLRQFKAGLNIKIICEYGGKM